VVLGRRHPVDFDPCVVYVAVASRYPWRSRRLTFRYGFLAWPTVRRTELRSYRELLVLLAGEIYGRERGALPPSDEALVGTYLTGLPDDGSADSVDQKTPTVE
jgi:hypothetical protein